MNQAPTGSEAAKTRGHGGRSMDNTRDPVFREVVLELLAEVGYDRLTMDAVADRAGASKPTIYRRWSGKADLVVDALNNVKGAPIVPDTGSLQNDLRALAESVTSSDSRFGALVTIGMVNALARDAELRQVFTDKFIAPRMAAFRRVFEQAVARGEMPEGHDLDLLARLFPALALQHLVISHELPNVKMARHVMERVVYPLATAPVADIGPVSKRRSRRPRTAAVQKSVPERTRRD